MAKRESSFKQQYKSRKQEKQSIILKIPELKPTHKPKQKSKRYDKPKKAIISEAIKSKELVLRFLNDKSSPSDICFESKSLLPTAELKERKLKNSFNFVCDNSANITVDKGLNSITNALKHPKQPLRSHYHTRKRQIIERVNKLNLDLKFCLSNKKDKIQNAHILTDDKAYDGSNNRSIEPDDANQSGKTIQNNNELISSEFKQKKKYIKLSPNVKQKSNNISPIQRAQYNKVPIGNESHEQSLINKRFEINNSKLKQYYK